MSQQPLKHQLTNIKAFNSLELTEVKHRNTTRATITGEQIVYNYTINHATIRFNEPN